MNQTLSSIYQYIAPAHRAIWRMPIFLWLTLIFWYANNPDKWTIWGPLEYIVLFLGFSIYYIASEFRHPRPADLGFSGGNEAKYWFIGVAVLGMGVSVLINGLLQEQNGLLWLLLALAATGVAYALRPKLKT